MDDKITIFGIIEGCEYCDIAKEVFTSNGIDFKFIDIQEDVNIYSLFKKIHDTVPQIYKNGIHLGGSEAAQFLCDLDFGDLDFD